MRWLRARRVPTPRIAPGTRVVVERGGGLPAFYLHVTEPTSVEAFVDTIEAMVDSEHAAIAYTAPGIDVLGRHRS